MNVGIKIISLLILLTIGSNAYSQDEDEVEQAPAASPAKANTRRTKNKRTEVNFEDQLIKGEVQKPELFYLLQKKQFNFSKLIKLRENFLPEMKKTAEDVPRGVED